MEYTESDVPKIPDYKLSELEFQLTRDIDEKTQKENVESLLSSIKQHDLAPYYKYLTETYDFIKFDEKLYSEIHSKNQTAIDAIKSKLKEAEEDEETELDPLALTNELAEYYTKIIDRENAIETYTKALTFTQSTGAKIDIYLTLVRIEFFFNDLAQVSKYLEAVTSLIDKGGDWERRNRFKTYNGIYLMATRNFTKASSLLIDSLATFTSTELCSYSQVVAYTNISGLLSLDRVNLKSKIIDSPEIKGSNEDQLNLTELTDSLYSCNYKVFLDILLKVHDEFIISNKYLHKHANYFLRELRCKAYGQLLESYKSLSLKSMSINFNVSEDFLDADLCRFISNKKLNCTIDKVNGIIETNRPDNKNNQYRSLIKQGDTLLTKLQKYGAAVKLSGAERV